VDAELIWPEPKAAGTQPTVFLKVHDVTSLNNPRKNKKLCNTVSDGPLTLPESIWQCSEVGIRKGTG
jgi:hypothetical protein